VRLRDCATPRDLLVTDEVSHGRTGTMGRRTSDVEPDILLSAKGIASGLPLGAFMAGPS
jgi:4-aminobutyrate aminotransferase